ncbi:MAG: methionine--tRNA ligase [Candidatus Stahlbacteria bacterium]|nr:MAG: methionine--tRNA ligase [Candidatus Stahlbacteria bacterium]
MEECLKKEPFYITTPIYYVNAEPHIGHTYTTVLADTLARFWRLYGCDVYFLTGTDEHGDKIMQAAKKEGVETQAYVDRIAGIFKSTFEELGFSNNRFIRTTDADHVKVVQGILQKVYDKGDIYFGSYGGYYCVGCERFYTEKEIVDGKCPDHQTELQYISEKNYFFKMSSYQDWLIKHIEQNPSFVEPEAHRNKVASFLSEPLGDLCISRPKERLPWGIPLPFDSNYVTYVWFDALINYLTAIGYPNGPNFRKYWDNCYHLIAKDILIPHAIYWPTMLKAMGAGPYKGLRVHGWWQVDETKISKSLGNVVRPLDMKAKYGFESFRYFLLREMSFGLDSSFNEELLVERINSDLANDFGNLVSRVLGMTEQYQDGIVHKVEGEEGRLQAISQDISEELPKLMEAFRFRKAILKIWELVTGSNAFVEESAPWVLNKEGKTDQLAGVLYSLLESLRLLSVFLTPFMPETCAKLRTKLGLQALDNAVGYNELVKWGRLKDGVKIEKGAALFPRIEAALED